MPSLAFWLDVDNTLIDNDGIKEDYDTRLQVELGPQLTARFWDIYEQVRKQEDVVDIPQSLQLLREETPLSELDEQTYQQVHSIFDNYPFFDARYPHSLETLRHLRTLGLTVIVSDGDQYFQAEKIIGSDLAEAVEGRVLLFVHKQQHLADIMEKYPADYYVMIDDKPQILYDTKITLGDRVITVFVEQGKYAAEQKPSGFAPDITVPHIGDLRTFTEEQFLHSKQQ